MIDSQLDSTHLELASRFSPFQACCACADIYGPSETLIGDYLEERGDASPPVQVLTKFCCFGGDMRSVSADSVREVHSQSLSATTISFQDWQPSCRGLCRASNMCVVPIARHSILYAQKYHGP